MLDQIPLRSVSPDFPCPTTNKVASRPVARERRIRETVADKEFARRASREACRFQPANDVEIGFRHSGWWMERTRVRHALLSVSVPKSRLERFDNCGSDCVIEWSPDRKRHRVRANYCGDRFCVPCTRARAYNAKRKLFALTKGITPIFGTLTLRGTRTSLNDALNTLLESFARLRRSKLWTERVKSGVYVIEIKRGSGSGLWHPHVHFLVDSAFIPHAMLKEAWRTASGGSFIVDVQRVGHEELAVGYIAKYLSKGWTSEVARDPDSLAECICALRGRRLLGTFGGWRTVELELEPDGPDDWVRIGTLKQIITAAGAGEEWACGVFRSLNKTDVEESTRIGPSEFG